MYEDIKEEMKRRYQNSRLPMLMQNYNDNKKKIQHPFINAGKAVYNGYKKLNGIDKAQSLIGKSYQPTEIGNAINSGVTGNALNNLSPISNAINSEVGSGISALGSNASNIGEGISALGNTSNAIQGASTATQGASSAAQGASTAASGASNAASAAPVVGTALGALSAGNNFANGDYVNGGLDAAATGAMFIPGVGWAISGAIKIGQMLRNALNSKKQKQMQKAQQLSEKAIQDSENAIANKNAEFDQMQAENQQNMQQQLQANGTGMSSMLNQQPQMQTQQPSIDNKALVNDIFNQVQNGYEQPQAPKTQIYDGQMTGGATSIEPQGYVGTLPDLNKQPVMPTNNSEENAPALGYEGSAQQGLDEQAMLKRSLMDKFRSGLSDFSAGYKDNTNTSLSTGDLAKNFQAQQEPQYTQAPDGTYIIQANNNRKGAMARLGEAVGTGQRIMSHPLTQAAIAGLISRAAGGDIDDVAKAAWDYGSQKAVADRYYQEITGNTNRPFINTYGIDDYKTKIQTDLANQKMEQNQEQFDSKQEFEKQKLAWQKQKAIDDRNAMLERAKIMRDGRRQYFDPTTVPGFYDDYDKLEQMKNIEEGSDEYNNELNDVLNAMYQGQKDGWWGKYSDEQINAAKQRMKEAQRQYERDFNKKYRINPLKGKKS